MDIPCIHLVDIHCKGCTMYIHQSGGYTWYIQGYTNEQYHVYAMYFIEIYIYIVYTRHISDIYLK
jgi:hypothetical protein